ncbi:hypothetical protein [Microbispora bryophytorum]
MELAGLARGWQGWHRTDTGSALGRQGRRQGSGRLAKGSGEG